MKKKSDCVLPVFLVSLLIGCAATPQKMKPFVLGDNPATIIMYDNANLTLSGPLICDTYLGVKNNRRDFTKLLSELSDTERINDLRSKKGPRVVQIPANGNTVFAVSQTFGSNYAIAFFEFSVEGGANYRIALEPIKSGLLFKSTVNFTVMVYKNEKPIVINHVPQPQNDKSCDMK